jgi:hypothetical protein
MSPNTLALIAGLISFGSALPYIIDVARGKTHPNVVTWLTWSILNLINTATTWSAGQYQTAIVGAFTAAATLCIVVMGFKHGVKRYTIFDYACQGLAILGIVAWQLTSQPALGLAIALAVDIIGGLPTLRHAWIAPFAETWQSFAIGALSGIPTFFAISAYNFVSLAFPVWITFNCVLLTAVILLRRAAPQLATAAV